MDETVTTSSRVQPLYRGTQIVWYLVGLLEALMGFRFVLKLLGANPAAGFTDFIYTLTSPFVGPFLSVFRITRVEGSVFEWTTLLAMAVYWLIAWAIVKLFVMGKPVSRPEAAVKLEEQDR
ncbi:MAG: YggT family protein [Candidatus Moraniibacteriota bacterium]